MPNYGSEVSRTLPVANTGYTGTVHLKLRPSVDAEHNLDTDLTDYNSIKRMRAMTFSGLLNPRAANLEPVFIPTLDSNFVALYGKNPNEFALQNFDAIVNGNVIRVRASRVNGGSYLDPNYISIELPTAPSPSPMSRQDFVFLEVWRSLVKPSPSANHKPDATHVYYDGNVQYGGTNPLEDLIQPDINATTSYRIQLQHRIRIVTGVNFADHTDGLTDPVVFAQGGGSSVSTAWRYTRDPLDPGLYIAGDGTLTAQTDLGNVDGIVYAIPICKIHRRNSSAYSLNNPNGSSSDIVNDPVSDRPDGLFFDEVSLRDIIDLRHQIQSDLSNSELLEHNFDLLLKRSLATEFGHDPSIDDQIQGTEMLTIDGFSLVDQSGVYDLPFDPDGLRRDYSGESRVHDVLFTFVPSVDITTGPVRYNKILREIQIILPDATIQADPDIYTDGTLRGDGVPLGWSPALPGSTTSGILNTTYDSGSAPVTIRMQVAYNSAGHRFIATNYYGVNNARLLNPEELGYVVNPSLFTDTRDVLNPNYPVVGGVTDSAVDYPVVTVDNSGNVIYPSVASGSNLSLHSYTRMYSRHTLGNNTNQYTIPNEIEDVPVYGVYQVFVSPVATIAFTAVAPNSVTRNVDGSFAVELPTGYNNTFVLKFVLVLGKTSTVLDRSTKGLKEIMNLQWSAMTVSSPGVTFSFETTNHPYGLASYRDTLGVEKFYAYVDGLRVDLANVDVQKSLNKVTLTFSSAVSSGQNIRFYTLSAYSPAIDDRIQLIYDRLVYQGLSSSVNLDSARIIAVGQHPLVHSIGTYRDTALRNKEIFAISEILPLGFGMLDSDLQNAGLVLTNSQFSGFRMLRLPHALTHDYRSGSVGKLPEVGDTISLATVSVTPERGIADKALHLMNRLDDADYPMEFVTPQLSAAQSHQVVQYYLLHLQATHELLMLVVTFTGTSSGNQLVKVSAVETGVAYDVFRISGKPILK